MDSILFFSFLGVLSLVAVHVFGARVYFLQKLPRSSWLSFAGGVSVAYVFVHLLPELSKAQETLVGVTGDMFVFLESHVYLVALSGLITFYGLERMAVKSCRGENRESGSEASGVFWLHIVSFAIYNGLIGYFLLHREDQGLEGLILFTIAMVLHFFVNDYGLREHHKHLYQHIGRWVLAGAIVLGWGIGLMVEVSEVWLSVLLAFIGGGVILNILKEELPEERESRFSAFMLGAAVYAVLLLTF